MDPEIAADLRPSADRSAVRTVAKLQAASMHIA